jgi:hypothetical protein
VRRGAGLTLNFTLLVRITTSNITELQVLGRFTRGLLNYMSKMITEQKDLPTSLQQTADTSKEGRKKKD